MAICHKKLDLLEAQSNFYNSSSFLLKIGCELEFFLFKKNNQPANINEIEYFIADFTKFQNSQKNNIILDIIREQGVSQLEVRTKFSDDLVLLSKSIEDIKIKIANLANERDLIASFVAQPIENDCGNALQFNISLHDNFGTNLLDNDEILHKFCQNLLDKTRQILPSLISNQDDLKRFDAELNLNLFKKGKYVAPTNLSYGINNRTCAIRIAQGYEKNKRIEYRIPSANANCFQALSAILEVSKDFMDTSLIKNDPRFIYGNAFDYKNLEKII